MANENVNGYVNGKYVQFLTADYITAENDKHFSDSEFDRSYASNPARMTPEQIQLVGHDVMRSKLWSRFVDQKYNTLCEKKLGVAEIVTKVMADVIKEKFPHFPVEVKDGNINKYREGRLVFPKIVVGRSPYNYKGTNDEYNYLVITPTLRDENENYFKIMYHTQYTSDNEVSCSDEEVLLEIEKMDKFISSGIKPISLVNKMHHMYDNQYCLQFGYTCMSLYDIEMLQLYYTLADSYNKLFGKKYPTSQPAIQKYYKKPVFGNIHYVGKFSLKKYCNSQTKVTLNKSYFYEDDKTKLPNFDCMATYGEWDIKTIEMLLDTLKPYVESNYFAEQSKSALTAKYDGYDQIGIGYQSRPDYFDILQFDGWDE